jgi:hypothetical protein
MAEETQGAASDAEAKERTAERFGERNPLAEAAAKRAERKAKAQKEADAALAVDLEALDSLEQEHGDSNVAAVRVGYTPGLSQLAIVKCPPPKYLKRFRDRVKPGQKDARNRDVTPDAAAASEEIAASCLLYPSADVYARMCEARPGLAAQLGAEAVKLAVGAEESEGKG